MIRRRSTPLLLATLSLSAGAFLSASPRQEAAPAEPDPESFPAVVATVNGTEIRKDELIRRADALRSQVPPSSIQPGFYRRVLDDMVSGELLYQSVETRGLVPTDAEVEAEYLSQSERFGGQVAFESALEKEGLSAGEIKLDIKKEMGIQRYVESEIFPTLTVSEEDKRGFYEGNAEAMQRPWEFRAAHILISVDQDATEEVKAERRQKAASLRNLVEMGQDFGELAAKNSSDPGSKDNGGELPWMAEGQTVAPFEAALKSLEPGELSGIVETQYGFHIIRLLEKRGGDAVPYEEVQGRIEEFLRQRGLQQALEREVDRLRVDAAIEVFI